VLNIQQVAADVKRSAPITEWMRRDVDARNASDTQSVFVHSGGCC
jgi:hypothetical protein